MARDRIVTTNPDELGLILGVSLLLYLLINLMNTLHVALVSPRVLSRPSAPLQSDISRINKSLHSP